MTKEDREIIDELVRLFMEDDDFDIYMREHKEMVILKE